MLYTIGETVLDIIFKNNKPVDAVPGGAMLNTAVSLGRSNLPVSLLADVAQDRVGEIIIDFLNENGVDISSVQRFDDGRSRLALAFLNEKNDAEYYFYKANRTEHPKIHYPDINSEDIILFGSFNGVKAEIRGFLVPLLKKAKEKDCVLIYDPNFRTNHVKTIEKHIDFVNENFSLSTIVKGSNEDFYNLYKVENSKDAYRIINKFGCKTLIYTMNSKGVDVITPNFNYHYTVNQISPLSTIGAGDNFNAGLMHAVYELGIKPKTLEFAQSNVWDKLIFSAVKYAQTVCMTYENYVPKDFTLKI